MRRQDELLVLFDHCDLAAQKFIIAQTESLALAFDSDELLEFLQAQINGTHSELRHQALFTLRRFLPAYVRRRFGLTGQLVGPWTKYARSGQELEKAAAEPTSSAADQEKRRAAALTLAHDTIKALTGLTDHPSARCRRSARLALCQFPVRAALDHARLAYLGNPDDFEMAAAYSLLSCGSDDEDTLVRTIVRLGPEHASLLLLLAEVSPDRAQATLMDLAGRCSPQGRVNLASILAYLDLADHAAAVKRLLSRGEVWVAVHVLRSLELLGNSMFFPVVQGLYERSPMEFVQTQCVRTIGGLPHQGGIDFCLHALKNPSGMVRAQALETLVRLGCPPEQLREVAAPILAAPDLRSRVNALLATAGQDEDIPPGVRDLLFSSDGLERLEAAFCLGYLQSARSLVCLQALVRLDPLLFVKLQALKSLSRYRIQEALPALMEALSSQDPTIALTAARVLARYEGKSAGKVCRAIEELLSDPGTHTPRHILYHVLGTCAARTDLADAGEALERGLFDGDARVVAAAVEGWILRAAHMTDPVREQLRTIAARQDPRIRPRAMMASILGGDADAWAGLTPLLGAVDEPTLFRAIETTLELGLLLPEVAKGRFAAMHASLDRVAQTVNCANLRSSGDIVRPTMTDRLALPGAARPAREAPGEFVVRRPAQEGTPTRPAATHPQVSAEVPARAPAAIARPAGGSTAGSPEGVGALPREPSETQRLRVHLEQRVPDAQAEGLAARLLAGTYVAVGRLAEPRFWEQVWLHRGLAVPVALTVALSLFVMAQMVRHSSPVRAPGPGSGAAVSVEKVVGEVSTGAGGPLLRAQPLPAGTTLKTGAASRLELITRAGHRVRCGALSQLTVDKVSDDGASLELTVSRGPLHVDFIRAGAVVVRIERMRVEGSDIAFGLDEEAGHLMLKVEHGTVSATTVTGASIQVAQGIWQPLD